MKFSLRRAIALTGVLLVLVLPVAIVQAFRGPDHSLGPFDPAAAIPGATLFFPEVHGPTTAPSASTAIATPTLTPTATPTPTLTPTTVSQPGGSLWKPALRTSWQWQLSGEPIDTAVDAEMFDVDLFTTSTTVIQQLKAKGKKLVCYISAGTWEDYRPDKDEFAVAAKGSQVEGWPGERWLDIRAQSIRPIMEARLDLCKSKGFDGVEFDNVDGYTNRPGFPLTANDQLAYNRFLAAAAHARGLSAGLKNDLDQVVQLQPDFDWAINEQCFQYDECELLLPFIQAGKAVFTVEYGLQTSQFCSKANAMNFNSLRKRVDLDAYRVPCR